MNPKLLARSAFSAQIKTAFATILTLAICAFPTGAGTVNGTINYPGTLPGKIIVKASQTLSGNKVLKVDGVGDYVLINGLTDLSGSEITVQYWFRGNSIQS